MSKEIPFLQWVQMQLTGHGFSPGPIDGIDGPMTRAAIKAFEAAHGLPTDGLADAAFVRALRADPSALPPKDMADLPDRDEETDDPETTGLIKNDWPRQRDCMAYYGAVGTNQTHVEIPFDMVLAWDKSARVRRMTLHRKVAASAGRVFETIPATYSAAERKSLGLDLFGGSLNVRKMRGGSSYSMHSWGIAIDFDPERNQLKWTRSRARLAEPDAVPFWQAWEAEGWLSLGCARNFDWMHVQAARL